MDLLPFIKKLFATGLNAISQAGVKAVTGSGKDISGAAKDVTGIRRDIIETKLAGKKLEDLESMIQKATLEDVERFCPRTLNVIMNARKAPQKERTRLFDATIGPQFPGGQPGTRSAAGIRRWLLKKQKLKGQVLDKQGLEKDRTEYLKVLNGYSEMVSQDIEQMMREDNVDAISIVLAIGTQTWVREMEKRVREFEVTIPNPRSR